MKLAVVTSFPVDPGHLRGGVEGVCVALVRALARRGDMDIHVVTTDRQTSALALTTWEGATVHRLPWAGGRMLTHATGTGRRQVQEYLRKLAPDVVHAHDTFGLMVKGLNMPRVFTVHGFIYGDTLVGGERFAWLRAKLWKRVEEAGWADQPHIISISPYVRERLSGVAKGTIHDIDNPIDEGFFHIARDEEPGTIFSAAIVCPRKNTLALIDAVAELVGKGLPVRLRLAGAVGDAKYGRAVEERIRVRGLADCVALLGSMDRNQVHRELARASVFALVSLEENSPMGIEEAMAAGVPVVTSNRCGMPYMVRDGESGYLVNPNSPRDIAGKLAAVLMDDSLRASMGAVGRQIALDRFHVDRVAARTLDVYRTAINDFHGV